LSSVAVPINPTYDQGLSLVRSRGEVLAKSSRRLQRLA
jgi:hypothetical protein